MPTATKDVLQWLTDELHKMLTKVILAKQEHRRVYYILVIMKDHYMGPMARRTNELLNRGDPGMKTIDLSGKKVVHNRLVCMNQPPMTPMIGSSLWRISNRSGEARCMYILPPDKPIMFGTQMGDASKFIWKSAQGVPLVHSVN